MSETPPWDNDLSALRPSSHSWVEVDLAAIRHNVRVIKRVIGADRHLWAVVKANAYGHGAIPIAKAVLAAGAEGLAVSCLDEAAELRLDAGIRAPLLVLAPGDSRAARWCLQLDITQTACSCPMVEALSRAAQQLAKSARVHLKVDTGMGRLGVRPEEAAEFAAFLSTLPGIEMTGIFSHLATAEAEDDRYAREQFTRFGRAVAEIEAAGLRPGMRHLAASASTLRFPEMLLDGVRVGLLIYGIQPEASGLIPVELQPAMTWKTTLSFLQQVPAGASISYGATFTAPRETLIGVLPLGYADGYPRRASNTAQVLLHGVVCPIVGRVCMDFMMVDVSAVPQAQLGDEVVLLGRQGNASITANQVARWAETVPHEVPTLIGRRVKRVYLDREQ